MANTTVEITGDMGSGKMLFLRAPPVTTAGGRRRPQSCPDHGTMQRLDPESYRLDRNGLEWALDVHHGDADLLFCPDCVEERYRDYDRADDTIEELVDVAINKNWREFWSCFTPAAVADLGEFEACPFCGAEPTNTTDTELTCPEHGPLRIEVERRG